jgi:transposase
MLKNRVHAILADRGIRVPERLWTTAGRAWLADLDLPVVQRLIVDDCLGSSTSSPGRCPAGAGPAGPGQARPRIQALQVLPGIGRLTAMTLVAEIGDIGRFATTRKLCAGRG